MLCRGELHLPPEVSAKLKCRYVTNNNPVLLIGPFKVEEAYHNPDILIYHDVMADSEIETIKKLATPRVNIGRPNLTSIFTCDLF